MTCFSLPHHCDEGIFFEKFCRTVSFCYNLGDKSNIKSGKSFMEKYAAIILAAGKGTRMGGAEGSEIPKVMYEIAGQPIIRHSVTLTEKAGIKKIVLVVGYKKELIEDYFGDEVEYAVQEQQLGTGHAVACAKSVVKGRSESVIVFYGDNPLYKPETIQKLIALYESPPAGGEKPTVAMLSVHFDDPMYWVFGRIIRDEADNVIGIVEQKDCDEEQLKITECNPGFYIFDADWLWENIEKLESNNVQHELYLTDMIKLAQAQKKRIVAMPVSEESEALGINNLEQLAAAEKILQQRIDS
jgi:bifunctional UDP-N-acetylglucosamine pyrophosphorylase/glucosamine-1-phosphate N-acetyltransferase